MERVTECTLPTKHGEFRLVAYQDVIDKLQLELNDMSGGIYNPGRASRIEFLEENKQALAEVQNRIADLEAEGRRNRYR